MDYQYSYNGFFYKWEISHADDAYADDRILISHAVQAINNCDSPVYQPALNRYKYVGLSSHGYITVITDSDETRIITAWKSTKAEIEEIH